MYEGDMQTAAIKNEEFHDLIDSLAERQLCGEVTLYIQGGNIESCRVSAHYTKTEVKKLMESRKSKRPKVLTVRKESGRLHIPIDTPECPANKANC
jgi:hypothetical protein